MEHCVFVFGSGINAIVGSLASVVALQGGGDYTEAPIVPPTPTNPVVQPDNRGYQYSADDLALIASGFDIEAGQITPPTLENLSEPAPSDPGDNNALYGRPEPTPRDQNDSNGTPGGGLEPPTTGGTGLDAGGTGTTSTD